MACGCNETTSRDITTYPDAGPPACDLLPLWTPPSPTAGCCGIVTGYDAGTFVLLCDEGTSLICKSLIDDNQDDPRVGAYKMTPSWEIMTFATILTRLGV